MNALLSLLSSRKTVRVLLGSALVLGTLWLLWPTFNTPEARAAAFAGSVVSIAALFGVDIRGIALEDAATKSAPTQQVNVGTPPAPPIPAPPPAVAWPAVRDVVDRPKGEL